MTKKLSLALMVGAMLSASNVLGLGVGDIKVNSALNQRLNAEIELISRVEGELDDVSVKLASLRAFQKFKLNRPYFLIGIQFKVTTRADGTPIVKLTTKESIREPFLDFLVEVSWPKGRMLREYTILLDPPVAIATRSSAAVRVEAPVIEKIPAEVIVSEPAPAIYEDTAIVDTGHVDELGFPIYDTDTTVAETTLMDTGRVDELGFPIYGTGPAVSYSGDSYGPVAAAETLWSIATRIRPQSVSNQQMMLALFEANPDAFVNGDIHQVKRGAVLRIPGESSLLIRDRSAALAEVRLINASLPDAGEYTVEKTVEQPGISERVAEITGADLSGTAAIDEGKLSLMAPDDAASSQAATASTRINNLKRELVLATETIASQRMENQELHSRVTELEGTVTAMKKLQRLFELQNQEMAQLQQQMAQTDQSAEPVVAPAAPVAEKEVAEAAKPAEEATVDVTNVAVDEAEKAAQEPVQPLPPLVKTGPMQIVMDYVNKVKNNPTLLGTVAGVILILLALIVLVIKRKGRTEEVTTDEVAVVTEGAVTVEKASMFAALKDKLAGRTSKKDKGEEVEEEVPDLDEMFDEIEASVETEIGDSTESLEDTADQTILEAPVDTGAAEAVAQMDFEEASGASEAIAEDEVPAEPAGPDPLEEVDVYEAFGDFEQAAEIVKQALANDADNNDFKLRLFNVYNSGGLADEYSTAAVQYEASMQGSSQWDQVVEMGKSLAPDCAAWAEEGSSPAAAVPAAAAPASEAGDMGDTMALDVSALRSVPEPEAQPEDPTNLGMDFDLGEDFESTSSEPASSDVSAETTDEAAEQPDNVMEFEGMGETAVLDVKPLAPESEPTADKDAMEFESADETAEETKEDSDAGLEFSLDDTAATESIEAAVMEEAASEPADDGLEFDLSDFDTGDAMEEPATTATEAAVDEGGLEFELDDDSISAPSEMVSETVQVNVKPEDTEAVAISMDDPSEDATVLFDDQEAESLEDEDKAVDTSMGIDLSDFDFDMDESGTSDAILPEEEKETEAEPDDSGLDALSLDSEEAPADELPSGDVSLDMEESSEDPTVFLADDSDTSGGSLSDDGDEVSTKLDLARAYIDMGDADGAKGILNEVVAEGNDAQKAEAESLLQQVG